MKKLLGFLKGDGFRARAIRSTGMTLINFGGENVLRLATNLILTRLLFPEAFGLMALVGVVTAGAIMFSDFGFRGAIIQDPRGDEPRFLDTAWTLQIIRGFILTALIIFFADPLAAFYDEPLLADLLLVAALVPLIKGFESTKLLTANRNLQLERATVITLGAQLAGAIVTIILAYWLRSIWALALGNLISPVVMTALSHLVLKGHSNCPGIERASVYALFRYGSFIFLASVAGFFANHGDRAVLGKFVSLEDLAIYNIAMLLALVPQKISHAISVRVIFPLYARRPPRESDENRRNINRARMLVTAPLMVMAAAFATIGDPLVRLLYDTRYEAAGPFLTLVALTVLPLIIVQSYLRLPLASGHSGRYAVFQIATAVIRFGLLLALVPPFGLLGAILAVPLATLLLYPIMLIMIRPYQAWDPVHDLLAWAFSAVLCVIVVSLYLPVIAPILEPLNAIYTR